ncbi:hypothetical protein Q3G72_020937 [Acer saccharum]|nr:hypothetical protein Q3G72_020937 [Acer saccharum]
MCAQSWLWAERREKCSKAPTACDTSFQEENENVEEGWIMGYPSPIRSIAIPTEFSCSSSSGNPYLVIKQQQKSICNAIMKKQSDAETVSTQIHNWILFLTIQLINSEIRRGNKEAKQCSWGDSRPFIFVWGIKESLKLCATTRSLCRMYLDTRLRFLAKESI